MSQPSPSAAKRRRNAPARPVRTCLATGEARPASALLRFVVGPDGAVVPDLDGRLPGRGLWLSAERDMVNTACAKGLFAKAARRAVVVPPDLAERVAGLMTRRCLDLIGLACRAGQAVAGFEKAEAWLRRGIGGVVLAASDGAAGGRGKIQALAPGLPVIDGFDARQLGAALGRSSAVHVVLAKGRLAERLIDAAGRLAAYQDPRGGRGDDDAGSAPRGNV